MSSIERNLLDTLVSTPAEVIEPSIPSPSNSLRQSVHRLVVEDPMWTRPTMDVSIVTHPQTPRASSYMGFVISVHNGEDEDEDFYYDEDEKDCESVQDQRDISDQPGRSRDTEETTGKSDAATESVVRVETIDSFFDIEEASEKAMEATGDT